MRRVERVVIVGRDAAAWLTALALHRAFGRAGVTVRVVELPSLLTAADAYAAVPSLAGLHGLLGLGEAEVLNAGAGLPVLGQRFANWSRARAPFLHGYDSRRAAIADIDFLQFWVKARNEGLKVELEDFSFAAAAAKQGRSAIEADGAATGAPMSSGYHLDARGYVDLLRRKALQAGIQARAGSVREVRREGEWTVGLSLEDGLGVDADLFVDASGAEAVLAGGAFESWRGWYGADRILTASTDAMRPLPAHSQIAAFRGGWLGLYPLRDRTAVTAVYASDAMSDREVADALPALIGRPVRGEATIDVLSPGVRPAWTGNCVAVGEAAVSLESLDAIQLHLVHLGLSQLIALFPVQADAMPEAAVYNRDFRAHLANVRDFQLAHYALNQRFDEPFWDRARGMTVPESLAAKIRKFSARGLINLYESESFQEQNWTASFVGHGLIPQAWDPLIEAVPVEEQMGKTRGLLAQIADEVGLMPSVDEQFGRAG